MPFPARELCVCWEEENIGGCFSEPLKWQSKPQKLIGFPPHSNDQSLPTGQRKGATSWLDATVGPIQAIEDPSHTFWSATLAQSSMPSMTVTGGPFSALAVSRLHRVMAKWRCLHSTVWFSTHYPYQYTYVYLDNCLNSVLNLPLFFNNWEREGRVDTNEKVKSLINLDCGGKDESLALTGHPGSSSQPSLPRKKNN